MCKEKERLIVLRACCYLCDKWYEISPDGERGYCAEKGEYTKCNESCDKFELWDKLLELAEK